MRGRIRIGGRLEGDIHLRGGGRVVLTGVRRGSVTVDAGASLILSETGAVSGDVINDGGSVEVAGSIDGRLIHREGTTDVTPEAVVVGGVRGDVTVEGSETEPES